MPCSFLYAQPIFLIIQTLTGKNCLYVQTEKVNKDCPIGAWGSLFYGENVRSTINAYGGPQAGG